MKIRVFFIFIFSLLLSLIFVEERNTQFWASFWLLWNIWGIAIIFGITNSYLTISNKGIE